MQNKKTEHNPSTPLVSFLIVNYSLYFYYAINGTGKVYNNVSVIHQHTPLSKIFISDNQNQQDNY